MKIKIIYIIILILLASNIFLLWQNQTQKNNIILDSSIDSSYLVDIDGVIADVRGMYTYPGFGKFYKDENTKSPSLLLTIFIKEETVGETSCSVSLSETEVYRRLRKLFQSRNQTIVFVTERPDSIAVEKFLQSEDLDDLPLLIVAPDSGLNLFQLGISPRVMPFKILYDSSLTPIYIRGFNNTPESQAVFEKQITFLSDITFNGWKN